jgi:putative ABC transport system permease protein
MPSDAPDRSAPDQERPIAMFLALREIRHARLRTLLIVMVIALVAWLVFLLSGLANGLASDNGASLEKMDAEGLVFERDVRLFLHRSILPMDAVAEAAQVEGVSAATPIGHLTVTVMDDTGADRIDATVLGIDPAGFLAPDPDSGVALTDAPAGGVVVDDEFKDHGIGLGDTIQVTPSGEVYTVVGFTSGEKYNHLPVIFMPLADWQALKFKSPEEAGGLTDPISAVVVRGDRGVLDRIAAAMPGVETATRQDVIQALPGYSSEMATVSTILAFLFVIAALVMAVFFYVITLQKTSLFGVLKAIGASTRSLAVDLVGQVAVLTVIGAAIGALLANIVSALIPANVPFSLSNDVVILYGLVLLVVAVLGSLLSAWRIARIDPLLAIGRVD